MSDQVINVIISVFPSVLAIFTMFGAILKVIHEFAKLKKQVTDMKCMEEIKLQLQKVLEENYELKQTLNKTMTKIDHIERPEDEKKH